MPEPGDFKNIPVVPPDRAVDPRVPLPKRQQRGVPPAKWPTAQPVRLPER